MTLEEIRELIHTVTTTGIAELEVQRGDNRVWIKRAGSPAVQEVVLPAAHAPTHHPSPAPAATAPTHTPAPAGDDADLTDPSLIPVNSPIVGTFYEASAPGAALFVKVGDAIQPGKVLCIIESMKLMNEIESEVSGTIVKRLVDNGQPVEYGEALFLVKPD